MKLNTIAPAPGAKTTAKRVGRGIGSGLGKTCGRGHKGQKARSGGFHKRGFEGGQMPLQMRLPKRGFNNINRIEYVAINLGRIQEICDKYQISDISHDTLYKHGIIRKNDLVKVLSSGELTANVSVTVHAVSGKAKEAIEAAGGSVSLI